VPRRKNPALDVGFDFRLPDRQVAALNKRLEKGEAETPNSP
jgi:hypothetical protein